MGNDEIQFDIMQNIYLFFSNRNHLHSSACKHYDRSRIVVQPRFWCSCHVIKIQTIRLLASAVFVSVQYLYLTHRNELGRTSRRHDEKRLKTFQCDHVPGVMVDTEEY